MSSWFDARFFGEVFVTLLVIMDPPGSVPVFPVAHRRVRPQGA